MTLKYTLILFTILLATAAISGCTYTTPPATQLSNAPIADGSKIPLNHLVVENPQTPEDVAVALLSSMDNVDTNGIEPHIELWSAEVR